MTLAARAAALALIATAGSAVAQDGVAVTLGFGPSYGPAYFGSDEGEAGVTGTFRLNALRFGPVSVGDPNARGDRLGWGLRGAFRFIPERSAEDHDELAGLDDIDAAVELGLGIGYDAPRWRAFADVRHGVVGHYGTVGVVGADAKFHVNERLTLTVGPRATFASEGFVDTYFGVSPDEAAAIGLATYDPEPGLVSAGVELGASFDFGNDWGLEGSIGWNRYQGDAADSPIVEQGSDSAATAKIMLTRRFSFGF